MVSSSDVVAFHATGTVSAEEIQEQLRTIWTDLAQKTLQDQPKHHQKLTQAAASALGIAPAELAQMQKVPIEVNVPTAGASGSEVGLIVHYLAYAILAPVLTDLAKDILKERLRVLWEEVLVPEIKRRLKDLEAIGEESPPPAH